MAFATGQLNDPQVIGAGERYGAVQVILSAIVFENLLKVGRFAKLAAGSIDNMDGIAAPVIAGVVLRNPAAPVESGATIDNTIYSQMDYMREGLATVDVKAGQTPVQFGAVYASNAGDANDGLATATGTDIATGAEFIQEIKPNVWLVRLK
ncbi:MAG: hypothetical protein JKY80_02120 [Mariprofundaceae bacterium]|nr:hypothetical protein [Methylophaga sp.]MBL4759636.1 hypothetical protein [Mariprofundaceae bacterium]